MCDVIKFTQKVFISCNGYAAQTLQGDFRYFHSPDSIAGNCTLLLDCRLKCKVSSTTVESADAQL